MSHRRVPWLMAGDVECRALGSRDGHAVDLNDVQSVDSLVAHLDAPWWSATMPDHFDGCVRVHPLSAMQRCRRTTRDYPVAPGP
jgi:hypothetical protein